MLQNVKIFCKATVKASTSKQKQTEIIAKTVYSAMEKNRDYKQVYASQIRGKG